MASLPRQGLDSSATQRDKKDKKDKKDKERRSRDLRKELKKVRLNIHIIQQKTQVLEKRKEYLLEELRKTSGVLRPSQEPMPGCGDELLGRLFTQEEEVQEVESQEEKESEEKPLRKEECSKSCEAGQCDCRYEKGILGGGRIWRAQLDDSLHLENHSILIQSHHEPKLQPPQNKNRHVVDLSNDAEEESEGSEMKLPITDIVVEQDVCQEEEAVGVGEQGLPVHPPRKTLNLENNNINNLDMELLPSALQLPIATQSGLSEVAEINDKNGVKDIPLETKVGGLQSEEKGEPLSPLKDPWKDSVIATIRAEPLLHEQILCLQSVRLKVVEDVLQANGVSTTGRSRAELQPLLHKLGVRLHS